MKSTELTASSPVALMGLAGEVWKTGIGGIVGTSVRVIFFLTERTRSNTDSISSKMALRASSATASGVSGAGVFGTLAVVAASSDAVVASIARSVERPGRRDAVDAECCSCV